MSRPRSGGRRQRRSMSAMSASAQPWVFYDTRERVVRGAGPTLVTEVATVAGDFFGVLGVPATQGVVPRLVNGDSRAVVSAALSRTLENPERSVRRRSDADGRGRSLRRGGRHARRVRVSVGTRRHVAGGSRGRAGGIRIVPGGGAHAGRRDLRPGPRRRDPCSPRDPRCRRRRMECGDQIGRRDATRRTAACRSGVDRSGPARARRGVREHGGAPHRTLGAPEAGVRRPDRPRLRHGAARPGRAGRGSGDSRGRARPGARGGLGRSTAVRGYCRRGSTTRRRRRHRTSGRPRRAGLDPAGRRGVRRCLRGRRTAAPCAGAWWRPAHGRPDACGPDSWPARSRCPSCC